MNYTLSYIISTKNRLPFLKILLENLLPQLNANEEIIVVDGNSTDGSKEYLNDLFLNNKIHQFISEPDKNQAHGWNKAFLMAKGTIIKKLIDDDVHDIDAIRQCKNFMLTNPEIDACISNCMEADITNSAIIGTTTRLPWFNEWKSGKTASFTFSDVSLLIRRSSLSFLGIFDTQFKMIDWEYSLRISYLQAKIAYYTGYNSISVATPGNVTSTATKKLFKLEGDIGKLKYNYKGDEADISFYSRVKIWIGKSYYGLRNAKQIEKTISPMPDEEVLRKIYSVYYQKIAELNRISKLEFIY